MKKVFLHFPLLRVWKRRPSLLNKVTLVQVFKWELRVEEEIDIIEEEEEEGEVASKEEEDLKEEVEGIIQKMTKETSNVTIVITMVTMKDNVD